MAGPRRTTVRPRRAGPLVAAGRAVPLLNGAGDDPALTPVDRPHSLPLHAVVLGLLLEELQLGEGAQRPQQGSVRPRRGSKIDRHRSRADAAKGWRIPG